MRAMRLVALVVAFVSVAGTEAIVLLMCAFLYALIAGCL